MENDKTNDMEKAPQTADRLVLFDGVCNLCNATVNFLIDHDPDARLKFASLQSEAAQSRLRVAGAGAPTLASIVFVDGHRVYTHSTAVLRLSRYLSGPWPALRFLLLVPRPIRDLVYNWVGRNRYRWFGRTDACRLPTPALRSRFLE